MNKYTTQMNAARKGILTPQMERILSMERISEKHLLERLAAGRIAIPANKRHACLAGGGVGEGLTTKINVNLGVSEDCCNIEMELNKVRTAIDMRRRMPSWT